MAENEEQTGQSENTAAQVGRRAESLPNERQKGNDEQGSEDKHANPTIWEWMVAAVGLALVAATIGFMLYKAIWGMHPSPDLTIQVGNISAQKDEYLVNFRVVNHGGGTAEGVVVEGELTAEGLSLEKAQTTIEYLPPHSEKKGGLFFSQNPRQGTLKLRALGYQQP